MEEWKDINGYENLYQVSNYGRVKRKQSLVATGIKHSDKRNVKEKILKQNLKRNGYLTVDLSKDNKVKTISIHRLVAMAFLENDNPQEKKFIDHINCNKQDNRANNLEWVSNRENIEKAMKNHLYNNPNKKQVRCKDLNLIFESSYKAGEYINNRFYKNSKRVSTIANKIRACCLKYQKIAYNHTWEYVEGSTTNS